MRIWSLHPQYLDRQGLTACWRESLLAQAVLAGRTKGYRHHSQLLRFRAQPDPLIAIGAYLVGVAEEATRRGYHFDVTRIDRATGAWSSGSEVAADAGVVPPPRIPVTGGQVAHEWAHLSAKLAVRSPHWAATYLPVTEPVVHPLFVVVPGPIEAWERPVTSAPPRSGATSPETR